MSACNTTKRAKVEEFTVNINSPQTVIGEVEMQFETLMGLGKLRKQSVTVLYFPKEDAVCLKYKFEFYTFNQFWSKRGRLYFINALQKYNEDYNARDLQKNNKSRSKYSNVLGYLVWQLASFTVQARANTTYDLGYTFKDNSPYFSVYQREAEYLDDRSRDNNRTSPGLTMFFTRAQAAELSKLFEEYIIPGETLPDEYQEANTPPQANDPSKDAY
jgi:hypothetical protein